MGLDQYAYARDKKGNVEEIAYWRKHNALDGWMQNLWEAIHKDEYDYILNGQEVPVDADDIEMLEMVVESDGLPETGGFFYGEDSRFNEEKKKTTLEFIKEAKKALKEGKEVFYQNSW